MALITTQRFLPLFITQFLGAFNDNILKNSLVILITYRIAIETGDNAQILVTLAAGLFILPFFIFSALAGQLADKFDRAHLTRLIKVAEIIIMLFASYGFILHNHWFLIGVLFAAGTHSTFFGPIKYVLLPQHLKTDELIAGNAYIEAGTFLAILLGTICGGLLILHQYGDYLVSIALVIFAFLGYLSSIFIPVATAPDPGLKLNFNLWSATIEIIGYCSKSRRVLICVLAISWFWLLGATFLSQFAGYIKYNLHSEASIVTLFLTLFSLGIGLGSYICSKLLNGVIKSTHVPIAAFGISIFTIDLYFASQNIIYFNLPALLSFQNFIHMPASWRIIFDILCIATCAGIYIVPLYAIVQHESASLYRARIIAANNVLNALFMVFASLGAIGMLALSRTIPEIFLLIGIINIFVAISIRKFLNKTT